MSLLKNVVVMLRGSLIAQAISFAALPLLARMYAPEDFGRYQIFLSIMGFLLLAASLRYEVAVLNAETDEYAFSLARLCLYINGGLAILTLIASVAVNLVAPDLLAKLGRGFWLLPPTLFAGGAFQTLSYLLLRSHAFKESSAARAAQALGNSGSAFLMGWMRLTAVGLMTADLAGRLLAVGFAGARMIRSDARYRVWGDRTYSLRHLLHRYREYPLISLPGSLLDGVGTSITPVLMFGVFGAAVSGQYALVERSIAMPVAVIAQAVSQVYMASFSTALRANASSAGALFKQIVLTHLKIAALPAIALFFFGRPAFELVFGTQWGLAGALAQTMAPLFLMSFLVSPVTMTLLMLKKQALNFGWYVGRMGAILSAWVVISRLRLPPLTAIGVHVTVNVTAYVVLLALIYKNLPGEMTSATHIAS
jgi:O-antigen/teichoic acid export membrane protein